MKMTRTVERAATSYAAFMEEVKLRVDVAGEKLFEINDQPNHPHAFMNAEFCCLQIRMICEVIALATLTAQYNTPEAVTKDLMKAWNPDAIWPRLLGINEQCFPRPIEFLAGGPDTHRFKFAEGPILQRAQLQVIYNRCGEKLHRGTMRGILGGAPRNFDLNELATWLKAIRKLLQNHIILLPQHHALLCFMLEGPTKRVRWFQGQADGPWTLPDLLSE